MEALCQKQLRRLSDDEVKALLDQKDLGIATMRLVPKANVFLRST